MLPVLSHIEEYEGQIFYVTTSGVVGSVFEISLCDIETHNVIEFNERLMQVLRQLSSNVLGRIMLISDGQSSLVSDFPRAQAINELEYVQKKAFLFLESQSSLNPLNFFKPAKIKKSDQEFKHVFEAASLFRKNGLEIKPLARTEYLTFFDRGHSEWVRSARSIETGTESIGVVRLKKLPSSEFSISQWAKILDRLPKPNSVNISFKRMDEARARLLLERKLKQNSSGKDVSSKVQGAATENAIRDNFEEGTQLFEIEILLVINRTSQEQLSKDLSLLATEISMFSECMIET